MYERGGSAEQQQKERWDVCQRGKLWNVFKGYFSFNRIRRNHSREISDITMRRLVSYVDISFIFSKELITVRAWLKVFVT